MEREREREMFHRFVCKIIYLKFNDLYMINQLQITFFSMKIAIISMTDCIRLPRIHHWRPPEALQRAAGGAAGPTAKSRGADTASEPRGVTTSSLWHHWTTSFLSLWMSSSYVTCLYLFCDWFVCCKRFCGLTIRKEICSFFFLRENHGKQKEQWQGDFGPSGGAATRAACAAAKSHPSTRPLAPNLLRNHFGLGEIFIWNLQAKSWFNSPWFEGIWWYQQVPTKPTEAQPFLSITGEEGWGVGPDAGRGGAGGGLLNCPFNHLPL